MGTHLEQVITPELCSSRKGGCGYQITNPNKNNPKQKNAKKTHTHKNKKKEKIRTQKFILLGATNNNK